jgi:CHAT domain-containing protein
MKYYFLFYLFFSFGLFKAQSFEYEWGLFSKKLDASENIPIKDYEKFESKYEKLFEKYNDEAIKFYSYYAYALLENKDTLNALQGLKYSYAYAIKSKDTTQKYIVTYRFGDYYKQIGNYKEAEKYYYANMYYLSVILGASSREYSIIYFEYIQVLMHLQKYSDAKPGVEGLLYYFKTLDGEKNHYYVLLLNYLANIHQQLGEYQKAIEINNQLISNEYHLILKDTCAHIEKYSNLGDIYREIGNYDLAILNLKKCKQVYYQLKCDKTIILAQVDNNLGLCYKMLGLNKEAEDSFKSSLKNCENTGKTKTDQYCVILNNYGDFYRELGRYGESSEILLKSLQIRKQYLDTNTRSYANLLNNLGLVYTESNYYDEALKRLLNAKNIYENIIGKNHQYYGNCLNNLASCYFYLGNYKLAKQYKVEALSIVEKTVGKNHFRYPTFLTSLALINMRLNNYNEAEQNLIEALLIAEKTFGKNHDLYANAAFLLAEVYTDINKFKEAGELYLHSINHYSKQLTNYFEAMSEGNQGEFLNKINPIFDSYNAFLINYKLKEPNQNIDVYLKKALENQILLKSLLGKNAARLQKLVINSNNEEIKKLYNEWLLQKNKLINRSKSVDNTGDDNDLLFKINEIENVLKQKLNTSSFNSLITFEQLKQALPNNQATVEFFRVYKSINDSTFEKMYGALIVKNNLKYPELIIYKNGNYMDENGFNTYSNNIDELKLDTLSYNLFYKPIQNSLKGISKIYVSLDGIFQKINLTSLYNPQTKKYLQDDLEVVNIIGFSGLVINKNQTAISNNTAELFGYPDYDYNFKFKKSEQNNNNTQLIASRYGLTNLEKLPGTKIEVEKISNELKHKNWNVNIYTNELASEDKLRKINSPNILHIATHGYYIKDVETENKLMLGFEKQALKENSFLRSGLLLAGVGPFTRDSLNMNSENDGILTAYEASFLNLTNTSLVVLSACQTGLGDNMGTEGVAGLQRSLAVAGAKNIITSLWPVDDNATQFFMTNFYNNFSKNQNIEHAFNFAKNETKLKYPQPYFWAAFILIKTFN